MASDEDFYSDSESETNNEESAMQDTETATLSTPPLRDALPAEDLPTWPENEIPWDTGWNLLSPVFDDGDSMTLEVSIRDPVLRDSPPPTWMAW